MSAGFVSTGADCRTRTLVHVQLRMYWFSRVTGLQKERIAGEKQCSGGVVSGIVLVKPDRPCRAVRRPAGVEVVKVESLQGAFCVRQGNFVSVLGGGRIIELAAAGV